ncbi:SLC13 family permease [Mycolicibacterium smegmatis]|uniref:SLC13 family permease n=1 Tax=Mycolicibacterium smegmatis TaxID=1772 RepID=UPI0020A5D055|nr:SLC13 family permease [Mycolicibacterium smegmatis]MCP2626817.1 SLC13 family permease [Mycolicibacterium smegmatis]
MNVDVVGGLLLALIFVLGTLTRVNIGALGLLASFVLGGIYLKEGTGEILLGFPASFFLLLLGVTYLFSVATSNGTMDWIVHSAALLVRGRALAVPVGLFVAATTVTAAGAPAQAAVAILAPVGIRLGRAYLVPTFVIALMIILGVCAGGFSPLNILAIVANQSLTEAGLQPEPLTLFTGAVLTNALLVAAVLVFTQAKARGRVSLRQLQPTSVGDADTGTGGAPGSFAEFSRDDPELDRPRLTLPIVVTLAGFGVVIAGSMVFGLDLGGLALGVAVALHILFPRRAAGDDVNWQVILLICGLVTFIAAMERAGTFDRIGAHLAEFTSPLVAIAMICFGAAFVSAFASSTATIGTGVALAAPLVGHAGLPAAGVVIAICLSSTLVDASPFSSVGALTVAGAPAGESRALFRKLLIWSLCMIVVAPLISMLFVVIAPW